MQGLLQNKKLLIGGGVAILLIGGYMFMGGGGAAVPSFSVNDTAGGSAAGTATSAIPTGSTEAASLAASIEQELINELLNLKNINLDRSSLDSPAYASLQDFSQPIDPEPAGRPNPFLPYDQGVGGSSTSTSRLPF